MRFLLQIVILIVLSLSSFFVVILRSSFYGYNLILRQPYRNPNYQFWARLEGKNFCKNASEEEKHNLYDHLKIYFAADVNVIYLDDVDIISCHDFIPEIAKKLHENQVLLAMNIDANIDKRALLGDNLDSLRLEYFDNKLRNVKDVDYWVSYLVFKNYMNLLTYSERRSIQAKLREFFSKSFIGYEFANTVTPTPDNKHPLRSNIDWNDFIPRDDDGDFIITQIPVSNFRRTAVINDKIFSDSSDGQFIYLKIRS